MSDIPSFGRWLKQRRKALDLTQGELARRAGCALATIEKLERDRRRPSRELAEALVAALEVPPEQRPAFVSLARGTPDQPEEATRQPSSPPQQLPDGNLPTPVAPIVGRGREVAAATAFAQFRLTLCTGVHTIPLLRHQWDPAKADSNVRKHGVAFADAIAILEDEAALTRLDEAGDGERFVTLGMDGFGRLLVVVYTWRGDEIQLISARTATRNERAAYEG